MRTFLMHNYKWIIPLILVFVLLVTAVCLVCCPRFEATVADYRASTDIDGDVIPCAPEHFDIRGRDDFQMAEAQIEEILMYPDRYSAFIIQIDIINKSKNDIFDIEVELAGKYKNLWLDTTSVGENRVDIAGEEHQSIFISIIVRTEGLADEQTDQLIRSVGIRIFARNFDFFEAYSSKTVCFSE